MWALTSSTRCATTGPPPTGRRSGSVAILPAPGHEQARAGPG
ncbi:hypothetical protein I551_5681 [Mycobacterium ulcerans str. Harvey]|uniref:Uncharacterized protein n=1 Tax=Mycobacterium ulcerans str. Harvey TaxID=1299332 RepID=A0ABN0QTC3_MYCUL|nr:hypothetical protein I551_5681 [Mycobacterium ulcerans str. Harvey]